MTTTTEAELTPGGQIVDYLDGSVLLEDQPEERVRQQMLRVLHLEYGYPRDVMCREVTIKSGATEALDASGNVIRADIVVYLTASARSRRDQGQIKFVVECKRPDVESGYSQLVSYIFNTSAGGGVWTNGDDLQVYMTQTVPDKALNPAPSIPRVDEPWTSVDRFERNDLERPRDVKRGLRICHNKLHGRGIDGDEEDLAMDMVRIILAKAQDEISTTPLPEFYVTQAEYSNKEGREAVAARVQRLFRQFADNNPGVFSEHERIGVSANAVVEVVATIQRWLIMTRLEDADEWDIMGSAYEQYTATHLKRQRGQFFTNRLLIEMMVRMLNPDISVKALDPAGGSGGFLTSILRHVRRKVLSEQQNSAVRERQLASLRQRLFMVEISPRLVKIAKTAMLLNGDGHSGMTRGDSLGTYGDLDRLIRERCGQGEPTLIMTNPPFAGQGEGQVTDDEVLDLFDVGRRWDFGVDPPRRLDDVLKEGCPPEMLFFERCLDWVAPGGKIGIVMPKSFLDTATYRAARHILFREAQLLAVINCHKNTFQPHTGVRTCVVLLRKFGEGEDPPGDYRIFMAISRKVGQDSEGQPIFGLNPDGTSNLELDEDLTAIGSAYESFLSQSEWRPSEYSFSIKHSEIDGAQNINPQRYLPHLNDSLRKLEQIDDRVGWSVTSLSEVESGIQIFKGPRLKTENLLVESENEGSNVVPYYTPSAVLQDRRDSIKWMDLARATPSQLKRFNQVIVDEGDILITRSGTIGRVALALTNLAGAIVSDDMIRVRIRDSSIRLYVYSFLRTADAQNQMLRNEYGAVQQHLEAHHIANIRLPIPDNWEDVEPIIEHIASYVDAREVAEAGAINAESAWEALMEDLAENPTT